MEGTTRVTKTKKRRLVRGVVLKKGEGAAYLRALRVDHGKESAEVQLFGGQRVDLGAGVGADGEVALVLVPRVRLG